MMYEGSFEEQIELESTKYPIYKQILEMESGVILDRNTDAIRYHRKNEYIPSVFWDNEKQFPKYCREEAKELITETMPRLCRKNEIDYNIFDIDWNIQYDYDESPEQEAKYIIDSNESIHIDGRAGTYC